MVKYYAGIDLGTSGCRLIIIDDDKQIKSSTSISYCDPDNQSPELWWKSVCQLLSVLPKEIKHGLKSLAINGTSGSVLLTDVKGNLLSSTLMYNDLRATAEAETINQVLSRENGGQGASGSLARVMWLLNNETDLMTKNSKKWGGCPSTTLSNHTSKHVVHQADYILGKLANNYTLSDENNCLKLGYDVIKQRWPGEELAQLGINQSMLPNVFPAGTAVAQIDEKQATSLGLPKSLQLVTGTTDSIAAFIATGANKVGEAVTSLGSTLVVKLIAEKPIFSPEHGVYSHRLGKHWLIGGASNSGAKVLQHYFSQTKIDEMTEHLSPNSLTGLNYYPLIKEGERFPIADVTKQPELSPRPQSDIDFFQGILEGIANIEKQAYQKLEELGAPKLITIRSVGGGSKNKAWTQIRQNHLRVDMMTPEQTEAAFGSALLALKGLQ